MNKTRFAVPKMDCAAEERLVRMALDFTRAEIRLDAKLGAVVLETTDTFGGRCGRSKPVPAPTIKTRLRGTSRSRSIDSRRAASNPAAFATASYAGAQTV